MRSKVGDDTVSTAMFVFNARSFASVWWKFKTESLGSERLVEPRTFRCPANQRAAKLFRFPGSRSQIFTGGGGGV